MRSYCSIAGVHDRVTEPVRCSGLDDPKLPRLLPKAALAKLCEEVEMAQGLCPPFDPQAYCEGHLTPVYFGSALLTHSTATESPC
jgi:peptide chain release factor 3